MRKQDTPEKTKQQLRAKLARDLAAVLSNPELPAILYNDLATGVTEMANNVSFDSAEMIEGILTAYDNQEAKRREQEAHADD